jgi:hypothetical protein
MASQINANNINGNYPIAGQDNNSQGFRDNFTNTKLNFQYAADEINDLQNKALLKAALTGQALDNNMNDNLLYAARIQDFSATKVTITAVSGVYTMNYAAGHYQAFTTASPTSVLAFTNWPPNGLYGYYKLQIDVTSTSHALQIPASVSLGIEGVQGISPGTPGQVNTISFSDIGTYEFGFGSYDNGTTITIFDLNRALTNFGGGDLTVQNLFATQGVSATGTVTGGNIATGGSVNAQGVVTGGGLATGGNVSAAGNVIAANFSSVGNVAGIIVGKLRPNAAINAAPDAEPLKFTAGAALLATPEAGAFEYDGSVFYASPRDDQRALLNTTFLRIPSTDNTLIDTNSAQNLFDVPSSVNLEASTTYEFEGLYYLVLSGGLFSHSVATLFALGGTLIDIQYIASSTNTTGNQLGAVNQIYATSASPLTITTASPAATQNVIAHLRGIVRTDTAGAFTPQIQYSAITGGVITLLKNSFFRISPVGASSFNSLGEWS